MTQYITNKIVGGVVLTAFIGIPLAVALGPAAFGAFVAAVVIGMFRQKEKQSYSSDKNTVSDELITTIIPTINSKK